MTTCQAHESHAHQHGAGCGHTAIRHADHVDYLHDGHLHHTHGDHCDEHTLEINADNPNTCAETRCVEAHAHGPSCGHEAVPHGDHVDYLVDGRLHHAHGEHCDDHGPVTIVR